MKKRILALLMAGALALGLTACGGGDTSTDADTTADSSSDTAATTGIAADKLKVGLILVGEAADAYNKNHIDGMREACQKNGMDYDSQVVVKANITEDSTCADAINELLDAGCNAIFADSFGHEQYMEEAAPDHPDVQFCHATGYQGATDTLDNTHNYFAKIFEARYPGRYRCRSEDRDQQAGLCGCQALRRGHLRLHRLLSGRPERQPRRDHARQLHQRVVRRRQGSHQRPGSDRPGLRCHLPALRHLRPRHHRPERQVVFAVGYNDDMISVAPDAALVSARVNLGAYYEYALKCLIDGEAIDQDWCGGYAEGGSCPLQRCHHRRRHQGSHREGRCRPG